MTREQAKSELMQIYGMLSEEKKQALDVLMAQADGEYISKQAVLDLLEDTNNGWIINEVLQLPSVKPQDCDTCEVGNPCLYCKHEFEPQESEVRNG